MKERSVMYIIPLNNYVREIMYTKDILTEQY